MLQAKLIPQGPNNYLVHRVIVDQVLKKERQRGQLSFSSHRKIQSKQVFVYVYQSLIRLKLWQLWPLLTKHRYQLSVFVSLQFVMDLFLVVLFEVNLPFPDQRQAQYLTT